ncbi:hypothetical protein FBU30_011205 [Linnemannia zychae]|nr:hypothetical protein FBU30_011205 [Linnemannia zychae]
MTSVIPPAWPGAAGMDSSAQNLHSQQQQQHHHPHHLNNTSTTSRQSPALDDQMRSVRPTQHFPELPSHLYAIPNSSQERIGKDPGLKSKTKRLSKALPVDPLMKQRHRPHKNPTSTKRGLDLPACLTNNLPLPPAPNSALPIPQYNQQSAQRQEQRLPPPIIELKDTPQSRDNRSEPVLSTYSAPSKKRIVIERPYSFYKVAPKIPQSITAIESPFGAPSATPSLQNLPPPWINNNTANSGSTYHIDPSQPNPFIPPKQFQSIYHSRKQQPHHQSALQGNSFEDSIPTASASAEPKTMATLTYPVAEQFDSSHHSRSRSPMPDQQQQYRQQHHHKQQQQQQQQELSATNLPSRTHSLGGGGKLQNRQKYEQEQLQHQQAVQTNIDNPSKIDVQVEAPPTRKNSGRNLFQIARQASGTAFRSVGLNRKSSAKKEVQEKESDTNNAHSYTQKSNIPSQPQQQGYCMPHFEVELGRNRSLPEIKPPSSNDHQNPTRGSSLTNPRTNPGPFRSRQKLQTHNDHQQIATAMSNEPVTALTTGATSLHDAYGGTTDDWRQAQQAEHEARERQKLNDLSPTDRPGHISINSVSTLNLPPSNPTVTPPQTMSVSRILLPDRDRLQHHSLNKGTPTLEDSYINEPTQESTSLAKATTQPGGILSQMQAATEKGQVVDPTTSVWSQKEDRYIQRSNTAPYSQRDNKAITEEDKATSQTGPGQKGPLEYSKSEGYVAASRHNRHQKRAQLQQNQQDTMKESHPHQHQYVEPTIDQHADVSNELLSTQHQFVLENSQNQQPDHSEYNLIHRHEHPLPQLPTEHQQNQISRSRAMSNESAIDTNKDLPPTPEKSFSEFLNQQHQKTTRQHQHQYQKHQRLRSESHPDTMRQNHHQTPHRPTARTIASTGNGPITSEESVLALSRSMSPTPNRRVSHERTGSFSQLNITRNGGAAGHYPQIHSGPLSAGVPKEHIKYGIDMLPLPVIPSPDETLAKDANVGILPQDVLKTLDPTTVQKVITVSVIASRVYKVLTLEEIENLKKEQEDLQKYVHTLQVSLTIESRMRDASHSLIRLHEGNTNIDAVKASTGQLHATTRKMDKIVQKIQESMDRLLVIQRLLLQHESAVLNAGMRRLDCDNRELTRTVLELEKIRDQEKEEKLKWKRETNQLRIQSMIFPNPPGLEDLEALNQAIVNNEDSSHTRKSPSAQHLQIIHDPNPPPLQQSQHDARLAALEKYMEELNEEISKKDEKIGELESQLRMIQIWTRDFAASLKKTKSVNHTTKNGQNTEETNLQKQLTRLQADIENGFRELEATAYELKIKADESELAKNKALEFAATTLNNSNTVQYTQQRPRAGSNRSRTNNSIGSGRDSPFMQQNNQSDLNMVLNDSLLELDHQISLTGSSSPSVGSNASPSPDISHDHHYRRARSPSVPHQHRADMNRGISRTRQPSSNLATTQPQQYQQYLQESKDETALGDAQEEIRRLHLMIDELENLVRHKINV